MALDLAWNTIVSPVVLFFVLGLLAALLRSDMSIPEDFAKGIAIYLMMAIGLKGGFAMADSGIDLAVAAVMAAGIVLSFTIPLIAYALLRFTTELGRVDAAAAAAHYGSISIVTFIASTQALEWSEIASSGHLVAVAALMEAPAIVTALFLAGRKRGDAGVAGERRGDLLREVALNASVVVLIGALLVGWATGERGQALVEPFFLTPLQGVLCLFLLDMGLAAGRGLRQGREALRPATLAFGLYMPLIGATIAAGAALLLGLGAGDTALLMTLTASASYIAVPAAMRLALPEARPSIYLTLSLGVTFPFNLTVGIPLYVTVAGWVAG